MEEVQSAFDAGAMDEVTFKRARHVVAESIRTQKVISRPAHWRNKE